MSRRWIDCWRNPRRDRAFIVLAGIAALASYLPVEDGFDAPVRFKSESVRPEHETPVGRNYPVTQIDVPVPAMQGAGEEILEFFKTPQ